MKKLLLSVTATLLTSSALAAGELHIYTWGGYLKPEVVKKFEALEKVKVRIDFYGSNEEMIAKLQAGGVNQYDIVVPTDFAVPSMVALKLLMPLDKKQIPNFKNVSKTFASPAYDVGNAYTLPFQWYTVGITYDKRKLKNAPSSWAVLFDPKQSVGKYLLMDSSREMMGSALKYLKYSLNTKDSKQAQEAGKLLLESKKAANSLGFAADVALRNRVISGEATLAVGYSGDAIGAMLENPFLGFVIPKEGGVVAVDNIAIPAKAPNAALAYKWINFLMDAKINAENANFVRYGTPNAAALPFVNAADRSNPMIYPPATLLVKLESIQDLGKDSRMYDEIWTAVKSR